MSSDIEFKRVASRQNPFLKSLRSRAREAGRAGAPVWLEGVHLCQEYLARVGLPAQAIFAAPMPEQGSAELRALWRACAQAPRVVLEAGLLDTVSDVAGAQGVGFLIELPAAAHGDAVDGDCVVLDRVQDPGNVGSILRTCAAAGVAQVLLTEGSAAVWSGKVLRAAQGAHFSLRLLEGLDREAVLARVRAPLAATTLDGGASLYAQDLTAPVAWCFGHEGQGVDPGLLAAAALRVFVPQVAAVESLNVAAAAAVCLFEQRRQRLARAAA
ncbi:RNA methyltransferase [Verticiella sediminum]|uniref:RNA methyltransferase n=1 Tax=Verticiella sediminum TaxID=1247510 RepID=A0A556ABS1_9BURK|nr:RNA methyltransferase [Verticiella sediminum]TSH90335.1 RNA methyltransferase [Verticiella sediminum]